ncbi:MAG: outer membrane protein assembly factor BamB [Candidatus Polarisedimenticolaceae bacterium]|nr:outer membrane protein assembly factor BamB [Candidatus Polarisedimenticolaceae bacterium]
MRLFVFALSLSLLLTGCSSWLEDDNSDPPAELVDITQTLEIERLWQTDLLSSLELFEQESQPGVLDSNRDRLLKLRPALGGQQIFIAEPEGQVTAHQIESGSKFWQVETGAELGAGPSVGQGLVILGSQNGEVIALDQLTGDERWRQQVSSEILAPPAISETHVVVHTIDGKVYGLDTVSGKQLWTYQVSVPLLTLRGSGTPIIADSLVIVGFSGGKLVGLHLSDGSPQWEVTITIPTGRSELDRIVDIDADPVVVGDVVYAASFQGELVAIALKSGNVLWRSELSSYAGFSVDQKKVYLSDARGHLWGIDSRTGGVLWKQEKLQGRKLSAPVVVDGDTLLVGDYEGYLHWLSVADGRLLAREKLDTAAISMPPAVVKDVAYVFDIEGHLAAYRSSEKITAATQTE